MFPGAAVGLDDSRAEAVAAAQFGLRHLRLGTYLFKVVVPGRCVTGRAFVTGSRPTNIVYLDSARIDPPYEDDAC